MGRRVVKLALVLTALAASIASAASASAASVPCTKLTAGSYQCTFYPAGDGIHGGAPVQDSTGKLVGYLNHGHNWIICQASGATVHSGGYYNRWWGYTEANDQHMGWVNAVYASGGSNDGPFAAAVPNCGETYGSPPTATAPPAPTPTPTPTPTPKRVPCTATGHGHYTCTFYRAGMGTPVARPSSTRAATSSATSTRAETGSSASSKVGRRPPAGTTTTTGDGHSPTTASRGGSMRCGPAGATTTARLEAPRPVTAPMATRPESPLRSSPHPHPHPSRSRSRSPSRVRPYPPRSTWVATAPTTSARSCSAARAVSVTRPTSTTGRPGR